MTVHSWQLYTAAPLVVYVEQWRVRICGTQLSQNSIKSELNRLTLIHYMVSEVDTEEELEFLLLTPCSE